MKKQNGLTLIEIVVAIGILALAMPGVMYYFLNWKSSLSEVRLRSLATQLAQDLMEEIASKKWDENRSQGPTTSPSTIGPDTGESRYTAGLSTSYDDVDDYNGLSESPPQNAQGVSLTTFSGFARSVQVIYVNSTDLDTSVTGPTNNKRIQVTVTWNGGSDSVQLVNVFSNR
ncbi:MAG: type II secretion system protein [Chlamydiae bacterium]|nr:type II secretion system protein [Chlamydiota bacterium]MBI3276964.1 type II secretion system protein [Chlamydiota bacterium]